MRFPVLAFTLLLAHRTIAVPISSSPPRSAISHHRPCKIIDPSCKHPDPPALLVRSASASTTSARDEASTIGGQSNPCDLIEHPQGCKHPDPNPPAVLARSPSAIAASAPAPAPEPQTIGNEEPCDLSKPNCKHKHGGSGSDPSALLVRSANANASPVSGPAVIGGSSDPCDLIEHPNCSHKSDGSHPPALLVRSASANAAPAPEPQTIGNGEPCDLNKPNCKHKSDGSNPPALLLRSARASASANAAPASEDGGGGGAHEPCDLVNPANCKHPNPPA